MRKGGRANSFLSEENEFSLDLTDRSYSRSKKVAEVGERVPVCCFVLKLLFVEVCVRNLPSLLVLFLACFAPTNLREFETEEKVMVLFLQ